MAVTNTPDKSEMKACDAQSPLSKDDPRIIAWDAYRATRDYKNTRNWALHDAHVDGSLWAAFIAGWSASSRPPADQVPELVEELRFARNVIVGGMHNCQLRTDAIERLDAALQAVPAASEVGWQPIESAPKDGIYIIAAKFGRSQELAWVKHSRWITAGEIADLEGGEPDEYDPGWTDGNDDSEPCFPTHWMPLEPPTLKASGEE